MLMGEVDQRQRLPGVFDLPQHSLSAGFCQLRVHQHHFVCSLDDRRVHPELVVKGREHLH